MEVYDNGVGVNDVRDFGNAAYVVNVRVRVCDGIVWMLESVS